MTTSGATHSILPRSNPCTPPSVPAPRGRSRPILAMRTLHSITHLRMRTAPMPVVWRHSISRSTRPRTRAQSAHRCSPPAGGTHAAPAAAQPPPARTAPPTTRSVRGNSLGMRSATQLPLGRRQNSPTTPDPLGPQAQTAGPLSARAEPPRHRSGLLYGLRHRKPPAQDRGRTLDRGSGSPNPQTRPAWAGSRVAPALR